jgi:uncharacterized membrane protein HdeD (DUF308 family)
MLSDVEEPSSSRLSPGPPVYCRFGKRNLDRISWLAPLLNNRIGDLLNLELRHEHLFFIQNDRVLDDIGYSEKGRRFSEADFGKPIRSLEDLKANGYWLVGRSYDPAIMREALASLRDGYYYCVFSNQCQDWTDRLRRAAERLEKERSVTPPEASDDGLIAAHYSKPVSPTEPASIWMGFVALALGVAAMIGPMVAANVFSMFIGAIFVISGVAHAVYGFRAGDWRNLLPILLIALGLLISGVLLVLNRPVATLATGTLIGILLTVDGLGFLGLGITSRPLRRGLGPLVAGLVMLACALLIVLHWPISGTTSLGLWVGVALCAGGWSTIWLSWTTRQEDASPTLTRDAGKE